MGWEKRGNQYYYYRKGRKNGRSCSEYVGRGAAAELIATHVLNEQLDRKTRREALRSERRFDAEINQHLASAEAAIYTLTAARLSADGHHRHKGQWRKRHGTNATAGTNRTR